MERGGTIIVLQAANVASGSTLYHQAAEHLTRRFTLKRRT
jgi:hypothetical protein